MIIARTPLRISFVGGGSDLKDFYEKSDGMVVNATLDKYVYAIVKERFDDMIYINYSQKECVESVDRINHDLVREAMRMTGVEKGIEITTLADIPSSGSGLGSSSSITVALLHALHTYKNRLVTAERLATEACAIEIDILGKPIGRQDQYAAAYGGINQFIFQKQEKTVRVPVNLVNSSRRRVSASLLLYYTGITRSADDILKRQKKNMATTGPHETMGKMVALVPLFKTALEAGDMGRCGELMRENWVLKQQMASGISNPGIEKMYDIAIKAGAVAGKIAGAGGGGFLLLIVPRERQNQVFDAMKAFRELPFMIEGGGSKIIFEDRSYSAK